METRGKGPPEGVAVAGTVPYDERLLDAERAASALLDFDPHAPAVTAIDELARELQVGNDFDLTIRHLAHLGPARPKL